MHTAQVEKKNSNKKTTQPISFVWVDNASVQRPLDVVAQKLRLLRSARKDRNCALTTS